MSARSRMLALAGIAAAAGIAFATPAHASVNAGTVFTSNEAGWQAHGNGWNFRYVQATVTLPDITTNTFKASFAGYGASLRLANAGQIVDLGISTTSSSITYNAAFAVELSDATTIQCSNGASPGMPAGDTVTMTLFYDYNTGVVQYKVTDPAKGTSFAGSCADHGQFFNTAQTVAGFSVNDWSPAHVNPVSGSHRLVRFDNTIVTSRTGIRSSMGTGSGHWPVQEVAMTSDGTPSGNLLASVPFAWGNFAVSPDTTVRDGRNFTVWMPAAA